MDCEKTANQCITWNCFGVNQCISANEENIKHAFLMIKMVAPVVSKW